jgi:hypothetical protein
MRAYRVSVIVLSVLVVGLACLAWSFSRRPAETKETWYTNTVEKWFTNTVEKWQTNALEVSRTTTLVQPVTNEVIKEVPAKFSALERRAATTGFRYINAPSVDSGAGTLYKVSPIAVDVSIDRSVATLFAQDPASVRKQVESALRSRGIQVAEKSPYHLSLDISRLWTTDVPSVALVSSKLVLKEDVVLRRQRDLIKCSGVVWSTAASKLATGFDISEDVRASVREPLNRFCDDYLKAKDNQKAVESRIPPFPRDFLAQGR